MKIYITVILLIFTGLAICALWFPKQYVIPKKDIYQLQLIKKQSKVGQIEYADSIETIHKTFEGEWTLANGSWFFTVKYPELYQLLMKENIKNNSLPPFIDNMSVAQLPNLNQEHYHINGANSRTYSSYAFIRIK